MNREEIAKQNLKAYEGLGRTFEVQQMFFDPEQYKEGMIITIKEAKSFAGQEAGQQFQPETSFEEKSVQIVFNCDNKVLAHKVNYQDTDEVETLSAVEGEDEYLVPAGTHFEITSASSEDDLNEEGFFEVDIDQIGEEDYQEAITNGATEIYDI